MTKESKQSFIRLNFYKLIWKNYRNFRDIIIIEKVFLRLEINSSKLLHRIEGLTKTLIEKEDEIRRVYVQLNDEANAFEKRIMQKVRYFLIYQLY